jgi:Flp pilus assembly pilin Flp
MKRVHLDFFGSEEGATAIEYAVIASMIFLVIIGAVTATASATTNMFGTIAGAMP